MAMKNQRIYYNDLPQEESTTNDEIFAICQRCKCKESSFSCLICDSFKYLCSKCDNYIHSLPSKQMHQRTAIILNKNKDNSENYSRREDSRIIKLDEVNPQMGNNNTSIDLNYKFNLSPINRAAVNKDYSTLENNPNIINRQSSQNYYSSANNQNVNQSINLNNKTFTDRINPQETLPVNKNTINIEENSNSIQNTLNTFKIPNAQSFSREYLYEINSVFEREKSELIYKNTSLQMTIERLKLNFTEQINHLNSVIEDLNKRSSLTIKSIQENCDNRIKQISDERDTQYETFNIKLEELENINKNLSRKFEENLKDICDIKTSSGYKISEIEMELRKKDEELNKIKNFYENKISELQKFSSEDKQKLIESYDKNINLMISEFDQTKEKLNDLLKDRENDIRVIFENHKQEEENYKNIIRDLSDEIKCHKSNIISIRNRIDDEQNELEFLREENDTIKRELRFHISELKMLDGHNKSLTKENEDLKIQISKLDKLIYGKIRLSNVK